MATEAQRRRAHEAFEQTFGPEIAEFVMEHLSPVPWTDVARAADLHALRAELVGEIRKLEGKVDGQFGRMVAANVVAVISTAFATAGLVFGAARLS